MNFKVYEILQSIIYFFNKKIHKKMVLQYSADCSQNTRASTLLTAQQHTGKTYFIHFSIQKVKPKKFCIHLIYYFI